MVTIYDFLKDRWVVGFRRGAIFEIVASYPNV